MTQTYLQMSRRLTSSEADRDPCPHMTRSERTINTPRHYQNEPLIISSVSVPGPYLLLGQSFDTRKGLLTNMGPKQQMTQVIPLLTLCPQTNRFQINLFTSSDIQNSDQPVHRLDKFSD